MVQTHFPVAVALMFASMQVMHASAQTYPQRPIRFVTTVVGGANDITARIVAQGISAPLQQPVIVDNRTGSVSAEIVAKASADGYTLLGGGGSFWVFPFLEKAPYDPIKNFSPVTLTTGAPNVLVVTPSLAVNSVKELIALAKSKPGELNYASGTTGGPSHLTMELFKQKAGGLNILRVGYKGSAPAVVDLVAGRVQVMVTDAPTLMGNIKAGKLRALAVTSAAPSLLAPGLPTVAASGVPGFEAVQMQAFFAPVNTSVAIIRRLNQEMVRFLRSPTAKETFLNVGTEPIGSSPEELAIAMKRDMARWSEVIKQLGPLN